MTDPTRITALAVTTECLITALEATIRDQQITALCVTPPFTGRMRARLHMVYVDTNTRTSEKKDNNEDNYVIRPEDEHITETEPISVGPERFIDDIPSLPTVDDVEDELRKSARSYSQSRHREWYQSAIEA
ncbi:hypothetical protein [Haloquadratum walsbyi]|jgi:hypothetical protein|uniref:DUF8009 domain-containing protein n=1 Tax=Haloquadratum walsbyi J07HQW2 TaxID=1238425 RepID=U1NCU6_9EURY|nr:hypothetical protein [Haloquadratum walsbyi]ERG94760.1 MAG: hypothetical protein J07HQW2_01202 [Haloquadratum walsbyi J07HQW2]